MNPSQIKLIEETWKMVLPIADTAAQLFYQRLFEIDPSTHALFATTNMVQQHQKLLKALGLVVENVEQIDAIVPLLQNLGRGHVRYGVEDHHYDSVGAALLWTLEQGLGAAFTDEAREAWTATYAVFSTPMRQAARQQIQTAA